VEALETQLKAPILRHTIRALSLTEKGRDLSARACAASPPRH
jgi:DNA-binding transcriptional LysR family regulator